MRYAVIADVHGNCMALEAVMNEARSLGADQFIFLGDYCVSAAWPDEVVSRIRMTPGARVICGNEEQYLHIPDGDDAQFAISRWAGRQLAKENQAYLDSLPERQAFSDGDVRIFMAHGSRVFIEDGEEKHFLTSKLLARYGGRRIGRKEFLQDVRNTMAADERLQKRISTMEKGVYLFGHTHIQWHVMTEGRLLINPGSCGLPLDGTGYGAPYTLLTIENGRIDVEERRAAYDVEELIERVKESDQYRAARVWSEVIFEEWRRGTDRINFFLSFVERFAEEKGDKRRPFMKDTWEEAYEAWKMQNK